MPEEECGVGDGSTGIVVCDWIGAEGDWSIVNCILGFNTRFMSSETGKLETLESSGQQSHETEMAPPSPT